MQVSLTSDVNKYNVNPEKVLQSVSSVQQLMFKIS